MKKILLSIVLVLSFKICLADQCADITLSQFKEAQEYFNTTKFILLWGACCDDAVEEMLTTNSVNYQKLNCKDFYQIVLEGKTDNKQYVSRDLDFAYVDSLEKGFFKSVGKILNYKCDPCTEPFQFGNDNKINEVQEGKQTILLMQAQMALTLPQTY